VALSLASEAPRGIRADSVDLPLFLHITGAMVLVGALVTAAWFLFTARRDGTIESVRAGHRTLLLGALPSFVLMRLSAEWIASEENLGDPDPTWIGFGYGISDLGLLLLVIATVAAAFALRRGPGRGVSVAAWLSGFLVLMYVVAIWAMTTKPA
jgi:heme A synthase